MYIDVAANFLSCLYSTIAERQGVREAGCFLHRLFRGVGWRKSVLHCQMEKNKPLLYFMLCQRDRPNIVVITCVRDAKRGRSHIHAHQSNGLAAEHNFRCVLNHISDARIMPASSEYILIEIVR